MTEADKRFRDSVRTWLHEKKPREPRPHGGPEVRDFDLAWQRVQWDGGWAGISWPKEYGGRGLSLLHQIIWHEEYARSGAPYVGASFVGLNDTGPTLIDKGSEEQKAAHLPRILRGETLWCQGYSEPEAGSDLANVQTRATIDGDQLVVRGEKIWTSYADHADFQQLLVRTDPKAKKHAGLSWVICDMATPGIAVEPLETITGDAHFCRVRYDDARIPLANVVLGLNLGWAVATSSVSAKRGVGRMADHVSLARVVEDLIAEARTRPGPGSRARAIEDDGIARDLGLARAEAAALIAMAYTEVFRVERSGHQGVEPSMLRIFHAELSQRVMRLAVRILGVDVLRTGIARTAHWLNEYFWSFQESIGGGTSEIQRNIVGERMLGLPR